MIKRVEVVRWGGRFIADGDGDGDGDVSTSPEFGFWGNTSSARATLRGNAGTCARTKPNTICKGRTRLQRLTNLSLLVWRNTVFPLCGAYYINRSCAQRRQEVEDAFLRRIHGRDHYKNLLETRKTALRCYVSNLRRKDPTEVCTNLFLLAHICRFLSREENVLAVLFKVI